jgi:hypothetical protein
MSKCDLPYKKLETNTGRHKSCHEVLISFKEHKVCRWENNWQIHNSVRWESFKLYRSILGRNSKKSILTIFTDIRKKRILGLYVILNFCITFEDLCHLWKILLYNHEAFLHTNTISCARVALVSYCTEIMFLVFLYWTRLNYFISSHYDWLNFPVKSYVE